MSFRFFQVFKRVSREVTVSAPASWFQAGPARGIRVVRLKAALARQVRTPRAVRVALVWTALRWLLRRRHALRGTLLAEDAFRVVAAARHHVARIASASHPRAFVALK